jgi:hypothetical protein
MQAVVTDRAPATARRMAAAAIAFLDSLGDQQRRAATLPFGDDRRYVWDYRPPETTRRNGLRLVNMTQAQQRLALALLDIGLSTRGAETARQIINLETTLKETERIEQHVNNFMRDPEHYAVCIFGDPRGSLPWAWHIGGHHLGVHFTIIDGDQIACTPLFFGANPATVRHGPSAGQRTLAEEEEWARALVQSLDQRQKPSAVFSDTAPADILTDAYRVAYVFAPPRGLGYTDMSGEQRGKLVSLLRHYVERTTEDVSGLTWMRIEQAGLENVTFAWAGPETPGRGHYYAIKGLTFLVEYDNTQNNANHIHTVVRDITRDWGEDLLALHYMERHKRAD